MDNITTAYAPAARVGKQKIELANQQVKNLEQVKMALDAMPNWLLVLNKQRQAVFCNLSLLHVLKLSSDTPMLGKRPGELFNCVHVADGANGCGTSEFCRYCGAVNAILEAQQQGQSSKECRLTVSNDGTKESLDLRVSVATVNIEKDAYQLVTLEDISGEKRRRVLESIFFHDVLNTAGALKSSIDFLESHPDPESMQDLMQILPSAAYRLVHEIKSQRDLMKAENNELEVNMDYFPVKEFIKKLIDQATAYDFARGKEITLADDSYTGYIYTDMVLLGRIFSNMLKNALEASRPGDVVCVQLQQPAPDTVKMLVKNPAEMPEEAKMQVFQRSFSTKGKGRGLGTYSTKLLVERYLSGRVGFSSTAEQGTTFWADFPNQRQEEF